MSQLPSLEIEQADRLIRQGHLLEDQGRLEDALSCYRQAGELVPVFSLASLNEGNVRLAMGQLEQAVECYEKAIRLAPKNPHAHFNLGGAMVRLGRPMEALAAYREALLYQPMLIEAYIAQGRILGELGRYSEAAEHYQHAILINPNHAEANYWLGKALLEIGEAEKSLPVLAHALRVDPDSERVRLLLARAYNVAAFQLHTKGLRVRESENLAKAVTYCRLAIKYDPDYAEAYNNLGINLVEQECIEEAEVCYRESIRLKPDYVSAHTNLAHALIRRADLGKAREILLHALEMEPDNIGAKWNLSTVLLAQGEYARGLALYETRFDVIREQLPEGHLVTHPTDITRFDFLPRWRGEDLVGKTLLIWGEQGVGDEILFAGVLPDVLQAGAHIVVECEPRLASLFARSFPSAEVIPRSLPLNSRFRRRDIDYQLPAGSLPLIFRPSVEAFPRHGGYLIPAVERVEYWRNWLASLGGAPKVGVSWRSMVKGGARDSYYTELNQWGEILRTPGLEFVNLQYGECRDELDEAWRCFGVKIHEAPGLNLKDDLDDAAALTRALDLVVSPKTSVNEMAGAVGVPAWLLTLETDWTLLGTSYMPWYPSIRVYGKAWGVPWDETLTRIARNLAVVADKSQARLS